MALGKAQQPRYFMDVQSPAQSVPPHFWNLRGRTIVFVLAASSIACLLADFYGVCPMRLFTPFIFVPAILILVVLAVIDRLRGDRQLWRAVMVGLAAGLLAAATYDVFRLPFVFSREWHLESIVPSMDLFKVFPRFGAMVLGEPIEQARYSTAAQIIGWAYHFSNGATFGVMYLAMIGSSEQRHWLWAVAFSVVLELGMLFTPYPSVFQIAVTTRFVVVTVAAHALFGVGLGLAARRLESRSRKAMRLLVPAPV